jgi:hypothetical protein
VVGGRHAHQVMSYGKNVGEPYMSELTLALLEDTGHYRVVNTTGGRFITEDVTTYGECSTTGSTSFTDFVFGNERKASLVRLCAVHVSRW